jgi:hypothetical protein
MFETDTTTNIQEVLKETELLRSAFSASCGLSLAGLVGEGGLLSRAADHPVSGLLQKPAREVLLAALTRRATTPRCFEAFDLRPFALKITRTV